MKKLGDLTPVVSSGFRKVTLSAPTAETGVTYYYKTTTTDETANKPTYETAFDATGWTAFSAETDIATANTATVYVQVVKVGNLEQKIYGWGQGSSAAMIIDTEEELNAAILDVEENGTIEIGGDIMPANTLFIGGTKSFTIDLKGHTINFNASGEDHGAIYFTGTGTLTITDSNTTGGKIESNFLGTLESVGDGKVVISGNASIISTKSVGFWITDGVIDKDVLEITGGNIVGDQYGRAVLNNGNGDITFSGGTITAGIGIDSEIGVGDVTMTGGTIHAGDMGILVKGDLHISGGTVEGSNRAINSDPGDGQIFISGGPVVLISDNVAMTQAPNLSGYTSYMWRKSSSDPYTLSTTQIYTLEVDHYYVEFGAAHTVTLPTGTGYSVISESGSPALVIQGSNFVFTVNIASGYHKGSGFVVKANGTTLTADTWGGYTIDNITEAQTITVKGVEQDAPAPDTGYQQPQTPKKPKKETPTTDSNEVTPLDNTVYNDPSIPSATIWLSGDGLGSDDLLVTETLTSGDNYTVMLELTDEDAIVGMYEISLASGITATGNEMYLTFDLDSQYAGQEFTLVHKKADATIEYLYATADDDGNVKFGPIYELSPFMVASGHLVNTPVEEEVEVPVTEEETTNILPYVLLAGVAVCIIAVVVYKKKKTQK